MNGVCDLSSSKAALPVQKYVEEYSILLASCCRFSCYYRFSDIAINSVNPSFI